MAPEKPCPWHAETYEKGRLVVRYCDVGPEGHDGSHIGERPRLDYIQRLRNWRAFQHQQRRRVTHAPASEGS